ncbi:MAG: hypothetical protein RI907_631 [Pseudomonadota bacterium]
MTAPATPDDIRVPFVTVTNWVRASRQCGVDIEPIFRALGMDISSLHPTTATATRAQLQDLMQACIDATHEVGSPQHFPVVLGDTFAFEYLADVETFLTTSNTLREAAKALDWIPSLVTPMMHFSLAEHGADARLTLHAEAVNDEYNALTWAYVESILTTVLKFARRLLGAQPLQARLTLRHPRHAHGDWVAEHLALPIDWEQPVDALWLPRNLLDAPLRGGFPMLHEQAEKRVVATVAERTAQHQRPSDDLADEDRHLSARIERALRDKPRLLGLGLEGLALEMGLHARTLQRRLKDAGETHSAIQARVRYELAQAWLQDASLSIEDIAERLGFSDRRSFTLAFSRWSGQTPSQFRRPGAEPRP